ncbi:MAG: hypothetical protein WC334_05440 [Kiritimatiellales bacterium]
MKEKATYRRFDLLAILAILGCIGMLCFEAIFIFELYNRAPSQITNLLPVQTPPATNQPTVNLPKGTNTPAVSLPSTVEPPVVAPARRKPVRREPVESVTPVSVPPTESEKTPARSESPSAPVVAPVG